MDQGIGAVQLAADARVIRKYYPSGRPVGAVRTRGLIDARADRDRYAAFDRFTSREYERPNEVICLRYDAIVGYEAVGERDSNAQRDRDDRHGHHDLQQSESGISCSRSAVSCDARRGTVSGLQVDGPNGIDLGIHLSSRPTSGRFLSLNVRSCACAVLAPGNPPVLPVFVRMLSHKWGNGMGQVSAHDRLPLATGES